MQHHGLTVHFATAGFTPSQVCDNPDLLRILNDNGITAFRMSYFHPSDTTPAQALTAAREQLERMVEHCSRFGLKAVYQVHHGTLVTNSIAAWQLVNGLPAGAIGIMLDPGNQSFEGFENWDTAARLLGDYLCAVGVKDSCIRHDPAQAQTPGKGWQRRWCSCTEGTVNWHDVFTALHAHNFDGTLVFMPFYHSDDPARMTETLRQETAYIRTVIDTVSSSKES